MDTLAGHPRFEAEVLESPDVGGIDGLADRADRHDAPTAALLLVDLVDLEGDEVALPERCQLGPSVDAKDDPRAVHGVVQWEDLRVVMDLHRQSAPPVCPQQRHTLVVVDELDR